jgi:hypothetical protein
MNVYYEDQDPARKDVTDLPNDGWCPNTGVARAELAQDGIVVSTMIPFNTDTDFSSAVIAGADQAKALNASLPIAADSADNVADAILELIYSGDARADRVPLQFGGTLAS